MLIVYTKETSLLLLHLSEVAAPADDIVLVFVIEDHLGVNEILNDLLTAAVEEEVGPAGIDAMAVQVVVHKWILVQVKRRAHVYVETAPSST